MVSSQDADLWINGGFFIFRCEIFDYMRDGEELVEAPFRRLIEADQLLAVRHAGFWRPMDTLKDKQFWRIWSSRAKRRGSLVAADRQAPQARA